MLTDAYSVGGWVGLENINAYVCLRCLWVVGRKYPYAFTMVENNAFGLKTSTISILEKHTRIKKDDISCDQS